LRDGSVRLSGEQILVQIRAALASFGANPVRHVRLQEKPPAAGRCRRLARMV